MRRQKLPQAYSRGAWKHGNISDIASVVISVPKRQISKAIGQKKANIEYFKDLGVNIKIVGHEGRDKIKINEIMMRGGENNVS